MIKSGDIGLYTGFTWHIMSRHVMGMYFWEV